jgi:hypothetical protein
VSFGFVRKIMVLVVAVGVLAVAGTASAARLRGVVVQHNQRAHSLVLALGDGRLVSVHTDKVLRAGRVVVVFGRRLRNGTYAARSVRIGSRARDRVLVKGVVTFVDRRRGEFTVSAGGASLLVRMHRGLARAADAGSGMPSMGEDVSVETGIDDQGNLDDQGVQNDGSDTQNIDLEGTILAIDTGTTPNTLTVSADDEDQSGQSVTVDVPSAIDISQFAVGQEVELSVSLQSDGTYLLLGSSQDGNAEQANNAGDEQGCQGDEQGDSCATGTVDLDGTVLAVDSTKDTLTISTEDGDQSGQSVTVDVPSTIAISQFAVGQQVELTVTPESDGSYLLVSDQDCQGDQQGSSCSSPGGSQ